MGCLLRRLGVLIVSPFVFALLGPIVGLPFSVLMHPYGLLLFTPLLGMLVVLGLLHGLVAGATFGLVAAILPIRVIEQILSPPRWRVRARFASAGFIAGALACTAIAHTTGPIHRFGLGQFVQYFSFLASFGLPAGAICGLVMLRVLRRLVGGRFSPDNNRRSLLDFARLRHRLPPGTGRY